MLGVHQYHDHHHDLTWPQSSSDEIIQSNSIPCTMAPASTYPAGGTWFDTLKKSFVNVHPDPHNDNAIETSGFLDAAESLTTLFGILT